MTSPPIQVLPYDTSFSLWHCLTVAGWGSLLFPFRVPVSCLLTAQGSLSGEGREHRQFRDTAMYPAWQWHSPLPPHSIAQKAVTRTHLITRGDTSCVPRRHRHTEIPLLPFKNGPEHSLGCQEGSVEEAALALAWKDGSLLPKMGWVLCAGVQTDPYT